MSVATEMARITGISGRETLAMMGAMAHRSAQMPTGVAATSTLAPVWYVPSVRRTQAPTRKLEYGPVLKEGLSAEIIEGPERKGAREQGLAAEICKCI
jgi:hypothetical protein